MSGWICGKCASAYDDIPEHHWSCPKAGPMWTVDEHLCGGRYGFIAIQNPDGMPVLQMWRDDGPHLELAKRIVELLNRARVRRPET